MVYDRKKAKDAIKTALQRIDQKVEAGLEIPMRATTYFLAYIMDEKQKDIEFLEKQIKSQLYKWDKIPSARTYLATSYLSKGIYIDNTEFKIGFDDLERANYWIQEGMQHPKSEDLRQLHFLNALRSAALNAPESCIHHLNLLKTTNEGDFSDLLMPSTHECFSSCGTSDDATSILELLGIKQREGELVRKLTTKTI